MWKYLAGIVLIFGLAVYVSVQDERAAQQGTSKAAQSDKGALTTPPDENHPEQNIGNAKGNAPSWYSFFRWPNGPTTWVIVLTLLAIAEQAKETAKATQAVRDSIPLQKRTATAAENSATRMQEANQITQESLQSVQRAYVAFPFISETKDAKVFVVSDIPGAIVARRFYLPIENTGQTPAKGVRIRVNFKEFEGAGGIPDEFEYPDFVLKDDGPLLIAPKTRIYSQWLPISEDVIRRLHNGHSRLFFWGWASYKDVFEGTPEHRTEFCHELRVIHLSGTELGFEISSYGPHNQMA